MFRLALIIKNNGKEYITLLKSDELLPYEVKNDRTDIVCGKEKHQSHSMLQTLTAKESVKTVMKSLEDSDEKGFVDFFSSLCFYFLKYSPTKTIHEIEIINQLLKIYEKEIVPPEIVEIDIVMLDNGEKAFAYESTFGITKDGTEVVLTGKENSCPPNRNIKPNPPDENYVLPEGFKKILQVMKLTHLEDDLKKLCLTDIGDFIASMLQLI